MIPALLALLSCQLAGEALTRTLALPLPGPVLGMILMVAALQWLPGLAGLLADQFSLEVVGPFMVTGLVAMTILHEIAVRYHK